MPRRPKMPPRPPRSNNYDNRDYADRDYGDRDYGNRDNNRDSNRDYGDRDYGDRGDRGDRTPPEKPKKTGIAGVLSYGTMAILAAVFILGLGIGIAFGSASTTSDMGSVATRYDIDRSAPNPELCVQFGASAIAMDMRAFLTLSPFNVYISQPKMQPGCVLRNSNWNIIQSRGLIDDKAVNECRNRMNTFGFTGDIDKGKESAQIDCIYQNDSARNLFLPQTGDSRPETNRF